MVTRNNDKLSFALGLTSSIIGLISLILACIGVALPSWYMASNSNYTINVAQANLFYSCFSSNPSGTSTNLICTSFSSYSCSTTSYQNTALNVTSTLSGCTNPSNGASTYILYVGPIYQVYINDFYNLRSAAALSIVSILFLAVSTIFSFLVGFLILNIYLIFLAPIFSFLSIIFGVCCLVTVGSVFVSTGAGYALFIVAILLEVIVLLLMTFVVGRFNSLADIDDRSEEEAAFERRSKSPIVVRRIHKRTVIN